MDEHRNYQEGRVKAVKSTTMVPGVLRIPYLASFEGVAAGLRADVKQEATRHGHRMSAFSVGDSHCLDCGAEVSVEHVHPFAITMPGLVYKGTALDGRCLGKPEDGAPIERVSGANRAKVRRFVPVHGEPDV